MEVVVVVIHAGIVCDCVVVIALKTGEREERYESTIADLKARLKNVSYSSNFTFHLILL